MQIDPATLEEFPSSVVIAHSLWDMTFHGFTQEKIREREIELQRAVDEIDAMTDEERETAMSLPQLKIWGIRISC